ncbi:MAG: phage tail protein [Deferribacterales bacterium]
MQYKSYLTEVGESKVAAAVQSGVKLDIVNVGVGDGGGNTVEPAPVMTELVNEVARLGISKYSVDYDAKTIEVEAIIPPETGGFIIRELGVFDAEGDLIAVSNYPATEKPVVSSGVVTDVAVGMIFVVSAVTAVNIIVGENSTMVGLTRTARVATTENLTLSGLQAVDGVAVNVGDRVLVKNQTAGAENGIYIVLESEWTRALDYDFVEDIVPGSLVSVVEGTVNGGYLFQLNTPAPIIIGSTALSFHAFERKDKLKAGAYRDVISGVTDIDPTKLLPNGAYGLGPAPLDVSNLNVSMTAGCRFTYDSTAGNKPSGSGGCGYQLKRSETVSIQVAFPDDGGIFYRPRLSGVWSGTWIRVATISDIPSIPAATTTSTGVVELATQEEADARSDGSRVLTPASVINYLLKGEQGIGSVFRGADTVALSGGFIEIATINTAASSKAHISLAYGHQSNAQAYGHMDIIIEPMTGIKVYSKGYSGPARPAIRFVGDKIYVRRTASTGTTLISFAAYGASITGILSTAVSDPGGGDAVIYDIISSETTTDALPEGTSNLYFTTARALAAVPDATTSTKGKVELATEAEAEARTDTARAVTPASIKDFALKTEVVDNVPAASASTQGKVELATTSEASAGSDTVRAVTPAGLAAFLSGWLSGTDWASSKSANGYQKLPGGLILQWGSASAAASGNITFPIAFPNACVFADIGAIPESTNFYYFGQIHALSAAAFSFIIYSEAVGVAPRNDVAQPCRWFALGY